MRSACAMTLPGRIRDQQRAGIVTFLAQRRRQGVSRLPPQQAWTEGRSCERAQQDRATVPGRDKGQ